MGLYRDDAVVLRLHKLGEADRIVTLLTRRTGRVRAVAKGVRRTTSKFGARLEPFTHVDAQLWVSERSEPGLQIVTEVAVRDPFARTIGTDYPRYTAGSAMLEAAERLTAEEREPALRLYLLLVAGLRSLAGGAHPPALILDSFLLRALGLSGWALSLDRCAVCGSPGPHGGLHVAAGGSVCADCRPPGSLHPDPETLHLLAALQGGDWPVAEAATERDRRAASGIVSACLQWSLERALRSLPLVERSTPAAPSAPAPSAPGAPAAPAASPAAAAALPPAAPCGPDSVGASDAGPAAGPASDPPPLATRR